MTFFVYFLILIYNIFLVLIGGDSIFKLI